MNKQTLVIKLGGALLESEEALTALFGTLKGFLDEQHRPLVLVHGGGCLVDDLLKGLGLTSTKKHGLRVTPFDQIPYIAGALAGTANKQMMAKAIATGIPAVGLCLADGGLCQVTQLDPELGAVGACQPGNPGLLKGILAQDFLPVVSSIGITAEGQLMNVNADQAATAIAEALGADLVMLSDVSGILDGKGKLVPELDKATALDLMEKGVIADGMAVKVKAALHAAETLGKPVAVASWRYPDLLHKLLSGGAVGTKVTL
ncbi:acetylglutamate kinase [Aeromonas diversa]|uniref:Acetylglutamate kinase n=1 Tax=Aeromonas diversa CDC 2478-85 TaxID=1268237 RepID=N9VMD1_9GAMM|nr:acetylglutamate kinase [Aeromonas diversa]ENY72713.1 acetylglutamate kinase [Aeromonas diversa CDC 2478-85]